MPKGFPIDPELTSIRRSIAQKNRIRTPEWYKKVRLILIKRNKSKEQIRKVKEANTGVKFTEERKLNLKLNHADFKGDKNPNWRGEKVGKVGVHLWLRKFFKKKMICEFCGFKGTSHLSIDWAKLKNKEYERKRENFIELCRSCHAKYDEKGKHLNK